MWKKINKSILYDLGYTDPKIVEYSCNGLTIFEKNNQLFLEQDGVQWMSLNKSDYQQVFQFYSHYVLAEGHCLCTGLGFALRENWLLSKKEVTKITVVEVNKNIIDYHNKFNPEIMEKLEVIHCDVYNYKGSCDTLLIDNFEGGVNYFNTFILSSQSICRNIKHNKVWFWQFELILSLHYRDYIGLSLSEIYHRTKIYFELHNLPELSEEQLFEFCYFFFLGDFNKCNFDKLNLNNGVKV